MRLHHLRVQALQAFSTSAEVDFDALSEAGLFLLHGNTGAGKTTLLDAVVFALFGKLPGARGGNARERADLAAPDLPTEVTLELTLRGERLRITRTPKQERPKVRGTGTTTVAPTVLLEAIAADGSARALASRHEEVAHELDRLLGMSREQFCQVVLLPQGQFATFLHAKSDDREELLARLFGTQRFEDAERHLTERRRRAEDAARAAMKEIADSASKLQEVLQTEPPEDWEAAPGTLVAWADGAQVLADAELAAAAGLCEDVAARRAGADAALVAVRGLLRLRERHAAALAELRAVEARAGERDEHERILSLARKAAVVQPLLVLTEDDARRAQTARAAAEQACGALDASDASPGALRAVAAETRTTAGEVGVLAPLEEQLRDRATLRHGLEDEARGLREQADDAAAWLADAGAVRAGLVAAAEAARLALARREEHEAAAELAAARVAAGRHRDTLTARLTTDEGRRTDARDVEQAAREAWLALREQRLNGMAAELADGLQDGTPCLVCGALEHPEPAAHLISGQVTAAEERSAQTAADAARAEREAVDQRLAETRTALAAAATVAGEAPEQALEQAARGAADQARATATTAAAAPAAEAALAGHDALQASHQERRARAEEQGVALTARVAEMAAASSQDADRLQQALAGAPSVAEKVQRLEAHAAAHEDAATAVEQAADAERAAAASAARAAEAAQASGFADAAQAAAGVLEPAAVQARETAIRRHDDALAQCRRQAQDPELLAAIAGDPPDEAAAMAAAREATGADAEAGHALERVRGRAEALRRLRRELQTRLEAHGPVAEEAATIRGLAMLVDGTSSQNRKRMRLRAYVLAARLEEIAAAASERLVSMTDGRYRLAHDDERASRGARSGLGLRVVDGWTGRDRHPDSLSGGETFLASLALALGLADVVAAEAGGARLETLFVDEGFGSLDERTLDEVLDVLDRLREGGRAVGVVSHVAELRQRIAAQLHVVKDREGSRVVQRV